jgi:hypothetical protein
MLTPLQLKSNYFSLLDDYENITGSTPAEPLELKDVSYDTIIITEKDSFTTFQWDNLVKVASIIESNVDRFDMGIWHTRNECGTAHCIAGWAESLAMNDTNYDRYGNTFTVAKDMLSHYVTPFFWITNFTLGVPVTHKGLAEQLVMKWFIKPILEEARRESYELSNEITQFIQKAKEETQVKELITA